MASAFASRARGSIAVLASWRRAVRARRDSARQPASRAVARRRRVVVSEARGGRRMRMASTRGPPALIARIAKTLPYDARDARARSQRESEERGGARCRSGVRGGDELVIVGFEAEAAAGIAEIAQADPQPRSPAPRSARRQPTAPQYRLPDASPDGPARRDRQPWLRGRARRIGSTSTSSPSAKPARASRRKVPRWSARWPWCARTSQQRAQARRAGGARHHGRTPRAARRSAAAVRGARRHRAPARAPGFAWRASLRASAAALARHRRRAARGARRRSRRSRAAGAARARWQSATQRSRSPAGSILVAQRPHAFAAHRHRHRQTRRHCARGWRRHLARGHSRRDAGRADAGRAWRAARRRA